MGKKDKYQSFSMKEERFQNKATSSINNSQNFNSLNWKPYSSLLNSLFFSQNDCIKKGSKEHDQFFEFMTKYQKISAMKSTGTISSYVKSDKISLEYKLPLEFDKRHCIPFYLSNKSLEQLQAKLPPIDLDNKDQKTLSPEMIEEFNHVLHLYLDFLQKQKLKKLKKLREFQKNLPIAEYRDEIINSLKDNKVLIVAGDTGCGKSSQIPQFLLHANYNLIACTQPRRIACMSLCKRVAFETLNEYGSTIGYQIRFEKHKTQHSRVIFMTEGLLLRQLSNDPTLSSYSVLILDEIHERHLQTDFLLGVVKCLVQQRSDIKVILMSATININLFNNYFMGEAPVIQIPGRLYPIELKYFPISLVEKTDRSSKINPGPYIRILQLIDKTYACDERGDLLIFLSGVKEITAICEAACLYAQQTNKWIILPLHSTLSVSEQEKVFDVAPEGVRKCIVSTNIAETSVTIDGIRFVLDSGKVKEMNYDTVHKMQRLKEFWVSQASAEQRKGRAGRTGPGVCYRLYSEKEYSTFDQYNCPEVKRVPLDSLILQMISMGLPNIKLFPFIDPPPAESLETALKNLKSHSALNHEEELTSLGNILSQIPLDISLGKILVMGSLFHQIGPVLSLVAAMSVQSPYTTRAYRDPECCERNRIFQSDHGDPFTLLATYREWLYIKTDSREDSRRWCKKRGLEEQRFFEMTKLRQQFTEMLQTNGLHNLSGAKAATSNERTKRQGEIYQLNRMKRDLYQEGPRKAKVLKVGYDGGVFNEGEEEERDVNLEIKDIDFKIRYDDDKLRELYRASKIKTSKEYILLKVILCSGLYPNIAIGDEHNTYKNSSEQFFHTFSKPFVALHPNSAFAFDPEVLALSKSDVIDVPDRSLRYPFSSKHQLLTFVSLLETNKVYVVNSLRVSAAQTLFLFAHSIDTNADLSTLVCDQFLELHFLEPMVAQNMLFEAVRIRYKWQNLLDLRIKMNQPTIEDQDALMREADQIEREITAGLIELYSNSELIYTVKRLLEADIKTLYLGYDAFNLTTIDVNPFTEEPCVSNDHKGGVNLTEYFVYNCLLDVKSSSTAITSFDSFCPYCDAELHLSTLQRFHHLQKCIEKLSTAQASKERDENRSRTNPNDKEYFCEHCKKTYWLSIKEILKHKKKHL